MVLPIVGRSPAETEALRKPPHKSFELRAVFNSIITNRSLLCVVVLFQVFLVVYITRGPNQSLKTQPYSPESLKTLQYSTESLQTRQPWPESPKTRKGTPESLKTQQHSLESPKTQQWLSESLKTDRDSPASLKTREGSTESLKTQKYSPEQPKTQQHSSEIHARDACQSRRIYVYDLPPMFNSDLKNNCNSLDPWRSKCVANLNGGFGPSATELAGVVPDNILPAWYWTDHYWGEVVYHNRMLGYKCRTLEPESATAFYIPFYVGLAVGNHLWSNRAKERDLICEELLKWVQDQEWFRRSNGSDHFIMLGRLTWDFRRSIDAVNDWGTSFLHMPGMRHVIRLSVEKNPWDQLEIAVPYPTIFHPRTDSDVTEWQSFVRSRNRTKLLSYVGGARKTIKNDFRMILEAQCRNASDVCRHVDCTRENCLDGTTAIMAAFLNSDFCLQPRGDGYTRRSVFDCMMAGSIPVFFWNRTAYEQYEWFVPGEPGSYSVFIDRAEVRKGRSIREVLEGYSRDKVEMMREKIIEYIPRFIYAKPNEGLKSTKDAFDVAIDGVLMKFKDHMNRGRLGI